MKERFKFSSQSVNNLLWPLLRSQSMLECFLIKHLLYPDNCSKKMKKRFVFQFHLVNT